MLNKPYYMAHPCPQCGKADSIGAWKGARMSNSEWRHDFSCCSDKCGFLFAETWKEKIKTASGRKWLRELWERLSLQTDSRMCGEPYPGYDAENTVKELRRRR